MGNETTRREFLKQAAAAGLAVWALPGTALAAEDTVNAVSKKSRVILAKNAAVYGKDGKIGDAILDEMLNSSIMKLTDKASAPDAWKKLFSPSDVVGIKANCSYYPGVSTRPEVVNAVIRGLKSAGVDENKIIIWDRDTSNLIRNGFKPNKDGAGPKYIADDGDWGEVVQQGVFKGRISKIISERITAMINLPVLKTHILSGISGCLKNHYGSFDEPWLYHDNCNDALADFSAIPVVKKKTRLVIVDALRPQHDGGPDLKLDAQWDYCALLVSTDPVAADYKGLEIIQEARKNAKLKPLPATMLAWLTNAEKRGVGVCDPARIELITV